MLGQSAKQINYVTVVGVIDGVINLVENDGSINVYRQRGISKLPKEKINEAIDMGILNKSVMQIPELPKNYCLLNEEPAILGKLRATFRMPS